MNRKSSLVLGILLFSRSHLLEEWITPKVTAGPPHFGGGARENKNQIRLKETGIPSLPEALIVTRPSHAPGIGGPAYAPLRPQLLGLSSSQTSEPNLLFTPTEPGLTSQLDRV